MARSILPKTNFSTGRIGKNTMGRIGTEQYDGAVAKLTNFNVLSQGSISRRQGTTLQHTLFDKYNNEVVRAIPFFFNIDNSFVLIFTNKNIQVFDSNTCDEIASIDAPYTDNDVPNIQTTQFGNYLYIVDGNNPPQTLTRGSNNLWQLSETPFIIPPTVESGKKQTVTQIVSGDPNQVGDAVVFKVNDGVVSADLRRTVIGQYGGQWTITSVDKTAETYTAKVIRGQSAFDGEDIEFLSSPSTVLSIATTSVVRGTEVEVTSVKSLTDTTEVSAFTPAEGKYLFINGGVIELKHGTINAKKTLIKGVIIATLDAKDPTSVYQFTSAEFGGGNNPKAVAQYEGRLVYAGTNNNPQRVWMSKPGDFVDFQVGVEADDAIEIDLVSDRAAKVQWLASSRGLIAGCSGSEVVVTSAANQVFRPTTVTQREYTTFGSEAQQPLIVDNKVVFVQSGGQKIRSYGYDFQIDGYTGIDITELCSDITHAGVRSVQYSKNPQPTLFVLKRDGTLGMALANLAQRRIGWADFETQGYIVDIVILDGNPVDKVFLVVQRGKSLLVERLEADLRLDTNTIFFDSTVVVDNKKSGFYPDYNMFNRMYNVQRGGVDLSGITYRHAFDWVEGQDRVGNANEFVGNPIITNKLVNDGYYGKTLKVEYVSAPIVALPLVHVDGGWITFRNEGPEVDFKLVFSSTELHISRSTGSLVITAAQSGGSIHDIDCSSLGAFVSLRLNASKIEVVDSDGNAVNDTLAYPDGTLKGLSVDSGEGYIPPLTVAEHNDKVGNIGKRLATALKEVFWFKGVHRLPFEYDPIRSIRFTNTDTVNVHYIDGTVSAKYLKDLTIKGKSMGDSDGFPVIRADHPTYDEQTGVGLYAGTIVDPVSQLPVEYVTGLDCEASTHNAGGQYTNRLCAHHLADQVIGVKVDGYYYGTCMVSPSGVFTVEGLPQDRLVDVQVGLLYRSTMTTLPLDFDYGRGSMVYQWGRPVKSMIQVWDSTKSFRVQGNAVPSRIAWDDVSKPEPLYSGRLDFGGCGLDENGIIYTVENETPYPLNISGIFGIVETRPK